MNGIKISEQQNPSISITYEKLRIPSYLKSPIDYNSVVSVSPSGYLALKFDLNIQDLLGINELTINKAINWIDSLRRIVEYHEMWWNDPLVNISPEQEIVFEWWHHHKKITVYVIENDIEYVKVKGKDIDNDMEDGSITSPAEMEELWRWISL